LIPAAVGIVGSAFYKDNVLDGYNFARINRITKNIKNCCYIDMLSFASQSDTKEGCL